MPFGSTTHFHMMFALEQFNISPRDLEVLDMSPPDMVAAWERGDINGGFVWDPALGRMKGKGRVLLTSGDLSNWGKATFDAMVARKGFTDENPEFACQWVKMVSLVDADYRANPGAYGPERTAQRQSPTPFPAIRTGSAACSPSTTTRRSRNRCRAPGSAAACRTR